MEVKAPVWTMTRPCPYCGQGGCLVFIACPQCEHLAIQCDEERTVFPDPHDLSTMIGPSGAMCPTCKQQTVDDFEVATDIQIREAGFQVGDYE